MEHAQRAPEEVAAVASAVVVLILILMEHAQRAAKWSVKETRNFSVLILILMEHAQRETGRIHDKVFHLSLNPYFNGTCSKRLW